MPAATWIAVKGVVEPVVLAKVSATLWRGARICSALAIAAVLVRLAAFAVHSATATFALVALNAISLTAAALTAGH